MELRTLGGLTLEGGFKRPKPLLLLAYLALEGPQERRHLAELFWPEASNGLASLSTALYRLSQHALGAVVADEVRAWTFVETDARRLLAHLERGEVWDPALYKGSFLENVYIPGWSGELEEWVYETRERIAERVQRFYLTKAEAEAAKGLFTAGASYATTALAVPGAGEAEPEDLRRVHTLLLAAEHPEAEAVRGQAAEYGAVLTRNAAEARGQLRQVFVGRERELEHLSALQPGQWAWVRGGVGMGKTSLLQHLRGRFLPARAGLPYATLEPLLSASLEEGEETMLRRLLCGRETLLLDDWEQTDPESSKLLLQLRRLRPAYAVVVTSGEAPSLPVDMMLELSPLTYQALEAHRDLWAQTGGVPRLVGAQLRGEPPADAFKVCITTLSETSRRVYLALTLLEDFDPTLVRRALGLNAGDMGVALEELFEVGLLSTSSQTWSKVLARDYLNTHPRLLGRLAWQLAGLLDAKSALPLYRAARPFWEDQDMSKIVTAYELWGSELLRRGFPEQAVELLSEIDLYPPLRILRSKALERMGKYREALSSLTGLPDAPDLFSLKGKLFWQLGELETAKRYASAGAGQGSSMETRAEALNTLGLIAYTAGQLLAAENYFRRTSALWRALGIGYRQAGALNNLAAVLSEKGEHSDHLFESALTVAGDNLPVRITILNTRGHILEQQSHLEEAERTFAEAVDAARKGGLTAHVALALNNLAVLYHRTGRLTEAERVYLEAQPYAQESGDTRSIGILMANLAELAEDKAAWLEALRYLKAAGHTSLAQSFIDDLPDNHSFRQNYLAPDTLATPQFKG